MGYACIILYALSQVQASQFVKFANASLRACSNLTLLEPHTWLHSRISKCYFQLDNSIEYSPNKPFCCANMVGASLQMARFVKLNVNASMLSSHTKALAALAPSAQGRTMRTSTLCQMSTAGI